MSENNSIFAATQLIWRRLPEHVGIVGPFPLIYANADNAEQPSDDPGAKPWGRLFVEEQNSFPTNLRQTMWRVEGQVSVQIFRRHGSTNAQAIVAKAAEYFKDQWLMQTHKSPVVFSTMRATDNIPENSWNSATFSCDFYYYERRRR